MGQDHDHALGSEVNLSRRLSMTRMSSEEIKSEASTADSNQENGVFTNNSLSVIDNRTG